MTAANGAAAAIAALVAVWQGTQGQETAPDARRSPLTGAGGEMARGATPGADGRSGAEGER